MPTVTVIQPTIAEKKQLESAVQHIAEYQVIPRISLIPLWHKRDTIAKFLRIQKRKS